MHAGKSQMYIHDLAVYCFLFFTFGLPGPHYPLTQQRPSLFHPFAAAKIQFRDCLITKQYQTGLTALFHPHPLFIHSTVDYELPCAQR